jgi:hypothetical protein
MQSRPAAGEIGLALVFAALGVVWILGSLGLALWEGFAPQLGFLPLIYGVLLTALAGAILVQLFLCGGEAGEEQPIGKPLLVLGALTAAIVGVEPAGFGLAIFLLLLFLYAVVERLPLVRSLAVATGTTAVMILIFRTWLGVPLPVGPLGI